MNLLSRKWTAILLMAVPFWANAQKGIELKDPSGKIQLNVMLGNTVTYSVSHGEDVIIETSPISMTLTDGTVFGKEPRLKKKKYRTENQMIYPPIYRKQSIKDHFNELTLDFKGGYSLVFRAYEDGVAYRFISDLKKPFMVESEQAVFNLPNNPKVFAATPKGRKIDGVENQYHSSFQNTYRHVELSKWDKSRLAFLPVLSESENGKKVCITEAFQSGQYHMGRLVTDGTVSGVHNVGSGIPDQIQCLQGGFACQYILHQVLQLPQSHTAGHTFTTGLGMTHFQKRKLQVHRT